MLKERKIPQRMCIGCREMKDKRVMLRVVKSPEGKIFVDTTGKANGRGAYVCGEPACLAKMQKSKLLNKQFEADVDAGVYQSIKEHFESKI